MEVDLKIKTLILLAFTIVFLGACGSETKEDIEDIKSLVHDYTVDNLQAESASITSKELIVDEGNNEQKVYELPDEEFFVSIAPFINETHPCEIHSLTGCQGELVEEDFDVQITDSSGEVILDETKKTEANGFIDLWLPRDDTYIVKITQNNKTTEAKISTFEGDDTCITTMQLS